eukprot:5502836-Ditylum_brightwellii.AAC.1
MQGATVALTCPKPAESKRNASISYSPSDIRHIRNFLWRGDDDDDDDDMGTDLNSRNILPPAGKKHWLEESLGLD